MTLRQFFIKIIGCTVLFAAGMVLGMVWPAIANLSMFWAGMAYFGIFVKGEL